MHIVHVGVPYARETLDGATRAVSAYAPYQARLGHQLTMLSLTREEAKGEGLVDGIPQVEVQVAQWPRLGAKASALFGQNLLGADIYHFHASYVRTALAARLVPVPYIVSTHGAYMPHHMGSRRMWNRAFQELLGRRHLSRAALVHSITAAEREANLRYAPGSKVELVANCLDLNHTFDSEKRASMRRQLGIADDDLLSVYLGRYDIPGKGLDLLLPGFERAATTTGRRIFLMLFGVPQGDAKKLRRMIPERLRESVIVSGPVLGEEKCKILSAADVFCIISRGDVMPTAALDALGFGLALLTTEETGLADFVRTQDAGLVVRHDLAEVAAAFGSFDPGKLLDGRRARFEAALAQFGPANSAAQFIALYDQVLRAPALS